MVGYIPNCAEAIEAMAATAAIGAIWSSTSPDFGVSGVLDRFSQIQPKVRITSLLFFFGVTSVLDRFSQIQPKVRISSLLYLFFGVSGVLDRFSQIQPKVRITSLLFFSAFLASLTGSHRYSPRFESLLYSLFLSAFSGVLNQFSQIQLKVRLSSSVSVFSFLKNLTVN